MLVKSKASTVVVIASVRLLQVSAFKVLQGKTTTSFVASSLRQATPVFFFPSSLFFIFPSSTTHLVNNFHHLRFFSIVAKCGAPCETLILVMDSQRRIGVDHLPLASHTYFAPSATVKSQASSASSQLKHAK
ncbi:hypothetical protein GGI42DRAFT_256090 [Trichoderma sp. SZMC 28013]